MVSSFLDISMPVLPREVLSLFDEALVPEATPCRAPCLLSQVALLQPFAASLPTAHHSLATETGTGIENRRSGKSTFTGNLPPENEPPALSGNARDKERNNTASCAQGLETKQGVGGKGDPPPLKTMGADWRSVYSTLVSAVKVRHYSPKHSRPIKVGFTISRPLSRAKALNS